MFIWPFSLKDADVEAIDAIDNQKLGRALGSVLRPYAQDSPNELWEVSFKFV
jgi:hypothetical protein